MYINEGLYSQISVHCAKFIGKQGNRIGLFL